MGIIQGTEKKIVFLNTHKPSPVDQATVNVIGVFSTKKAITEQLITSIKDVTVVTESDDIYKILQAVFNGGAKQVLVFGKAVTGNNYKDLFDSVKNDWFGTVTDETDLEKIALISKEIGARQKMLFAQVKKDEDIMNSESKIKAIAEDTTALFFNKNEGLRFCSLRVNTLRPVLTANLKSIRFAKDEASALSCTVANIFS